MVYSILTLLLVGSAALVAGVAAGFAIGARFSRRPLPPPSGSNPQLKQLLRQQQDYRHNAAKHFTDAARLLDNLLENYRALYSHLSGGTRTLCDDRADTILHQFPDPLPPGTGTPAQPETLKAPRDYVPRDSHSTAGVLNETFGLDKNAPRPEPE